MTTVTEDGNVWGVSMDHENAPFDLTLYLNHYDETIVLTKDDLVKMLKALKAAEGATEL